MTAKFESLKTSTAALFGALFFTVVLVVASAPHVAVA